MTTTEKIPSVDFEFVLAKHPEGNLRIYEKGFMVEWGRNIPEELDISELQSVVNSAVELMGRTFGSNCPDVVKFNTRYDLSNGPAHYKVGFVNRQ